MHMGDKSRKGVTRCISDISYRENFQLTVLFSNMEDRKGREIKRHNPIYNKVAMECVMTGKKSAEKTVREIRWKTRNKYPAEE